MPRRRLEYAIDPVDAALSVARHAGLRADTARPLSLVGRAVILVEPCDVVAKISPLDDRVRCETEVALATHILQEKGPVVPPLLAGEPGPHVHGDAIVSLWEHCSTGKNSALPEHVAAEAYSQIIPNLQSYRGNLPDFRPPIRACQRAVQRDRPGNLTDDALSLLRKEFETFDQLEFSPEETRNLLGDPHLGNLIRSDGETLWLDLKAACTGPLEWDLAGLPRSACLDTRRPELLHQLQRLRSACVVVWCALKERPAPVEVEAIRVHLELLTGRSTNPTR